MYFSIIFNITITTRIMHVSLYAHTFISYRYSDVDVISEKVNENFNHVWVID